MKLINKNLFRLTLLFLVLVELLSLASFVFPTLNTVAFFVILIIALILSLKNLEWGLYIVLAELFIGSFGRLFFLEVDGIQISLRIGLFLVIMAVWLGKLLSRKDIKPQSNIKDFFSSKLGRWYTGLGIVLVWGVVWGISRNSLSDVFFDFNNWLYFLYLFPFYSEFVVRNKIRDKKLKQEVNSYQLTAKSDFKNNTGNLQVINILTILAAAVIILSFKTIILEWLFAHQTAFVFKTVYFWVRDFGIGEVTFFASNFYRVFIQGQIWLLMGFFIFLGIFVKKYSRAEFNSASNSTRPYTQLYPSFSEAGKFGMVDTRLLLLILILSSTALIISFSRSLWLGLTVGLLVFFLVLLFKFKWPFIRVFKWGVSFLGILALELLLILVIINLPPVKGGGNLGSIVSDRLTQGEAASSSRINQLQPLFYEIIKHPLVGSGFGSTATYISSDPRIVGSTAGGTGEYTTYAFEWGFLDILLKLGLIGLVVYLGLLWQLAKSAWKLISTKLQATDYGLQIAFGFLLALISLVFTNITTPYLNHPLGIGFVILISLFVRRTNKQI